MPEKKFIPKIGQTDFTNTRWCPVINCIVKFENKILIVKRNSEMKLYPNLWNGVSGFLDDQKSLEDKVKEELSEEIGIFDNDIISITRGEILVKDSPSYRKTWIIFPILVIVNKSEIMLDWESQEYAWIDKADLDKYQTVPEFDQVVNSALKSI